MIVCISEIVNHKIKKYIYIWKWYIILNGSSTEKMKIIPPKYQQNGLKIHAMDATYGNLNWYRMVLEWVYPWFFNIKPSTCNWKGLLLLFLWFGNSMAKALREYVSFTLNDINIYNYTSKSMCMNIHGTFTIFENNSLVLQCLAEI